MEHSRLVKRILQLKLGYLNKNFAESALLHKYAVAEYQHETGHQVIFENTSVIAKNTHYIYRKIRKSVEIIKHSNNFNRYSGYLL